jgi:hypothetical protein
MKKKKPYSEHFIDTVDLRKISSFLQMENPDMPDRVADAIANSIVSSTFMQLVLDEFMYDMPKSVEDSFYNDNINYIHNEKETVH